MGRTEEARIEEVTDQLESLSDDASPSKIGKWVAEMGRALDEDASDEMADLFESDMVHDLEGSEPTTENVEGEQGLEI